MRLPSRLSLAALILGPLLVVAGSALLLGTGAPASDAAVQYAAHPPLGHTGGFGEPTCQACHFGRGLNEGDGTLTVTGLPDTVETGRSYSLAISLEAAMERAGFMLALRHPDGTQAGRLRSDDTTRVAVGTVDSTGVQYGHHTLDGTALTDPGRSAWALRWTAPKAPGDSIAVHVAANAANDDASAFGDDIYSTETGVVLEE